MNQNDISTLNLLLLSVNRALWGEVIPSLRAVRLEWKPGDEIAYLIFYHHGKITPKVEDHYFYIHSETEIEADIPRIDYNIIRCDYPHRLPQEKYLIYLRKEPFVDP